MGACYVEDASYVFYDIYIKLNYQLTYGSIATVFNTLAGITGRDYKWGLQVGITRRDYDWGLLGNHKGMGNECRDIPGMHGHFLG